MTDTNKYSWGHAGRVRVARAALGETTAEFARHFGVRRRTVQRIETGEDPVPVGLWADIQEAVEDMRARIDEIMAQLPDPDSGDPVSPYVLDVEDTAAVQAAAVVNLALDRGEFLPVADHDNQERTGDEHPEVSEPDSGSGEDRS